MDAFAGGNAGSLVGVAISASLLPPAVNAGQLSIDSQIWFRIIMESCMLRTRALFI